MLTGDFPVTTTASVSAVGQTEKKIPSLFDIEITRPSLMSSANRPVGQV
jgi:hypothetical protein